jgi:hypothetical protein
MAEGRTILQSSGKRRITPDGKRVISSSAIPCCCNPWKIIHKFDSSGNILWSVCPSFVPYNATTPTQVYEAFVLLLVGSRLIAYITPLNQLGADAWICEIDTSTGETGAWHTAKPNYVDLFSDGSHIYGCLPYTIDDPILNPFPRMYAIDQISLTDFSVVASSAWFPFSGPVSPWTNFNTWDPDAGIVVVPDYKTIDYRAGQFDPTGFPPPTDPNIYNTASSPTPMAQTNNLVPLGGGVYQGGRRRFEYVTVGPDVTTDVFGTWSGDSNMTGRIFIDASNVFAIPGQAGSGGANNIFVTTGSGSGGASSVWLAAGSGSAFDSFPWSASTNTDLVALACSSSGTSGSVEALEVRNLSDSTRAWSVQWPAQRNLTGGAVTRAVAITDADIVFAGTRFTYTMPLF